MKKRELLIDHPSRLNSLLRPSFVPRKGVGRIVLAGNYNSPDQVRLERELNKYYYACGCSAGAKALIFGLLIFGIYSAYNYFNADWSIGKGLLVMTGGAIFMSLLGKFYGLGVAFLNLKRTVKEIQSGWEVVRIEKNGIGCG